MTLEKLLNSSALEAEQITTAQLEEFFAPYLNITRPERQKEVKAQTVVHSGGGVKSAAQSKRDILNAKLRQLGLPEI